MVPRIRPADPGRDDTPPSFAVVVEDISAVRDTLDTRRAGEERYRQLFELSPEATLVSSTGASTSPAPPAAAPNAPN